MDTQDITKWGLAIISLILFGIPYFNKKLTAGQLRNIHIVNNIIFVVFTLILVSTYTFVKKV